MGLAPELPNKVYGSVFDDHIVTFHRDKWYKPPGILFASRQIHREAVRVFYATATFTATSVYVLQHRMARVKDYGLASLYHVRLDTLQVFDNSFRRKNFRSAFARSSNADLIIARIYLGGRWASRDSSKIL